MSLPLYSISSLKKIQGNYKSRGDPNALFFADDSLLLADNEQELKAKIMFI